MTLRIALPDELESAIRARSTQTGATPEDIAIQCLTDELLDSDRRSRARTPEQRLAALHEWVNFSRAGVPEADDSRDSIYQDRT